MNERWLLFLVAAGALATPRIGAWLARQSSDPDDVGPWIVLVNTSPDPVTLDRVSHFVLAMNGGRVIAPGLCARVQRIAASPQDLAIAWVIAGRAHRATVTIDSGDATFAIGSDLAPRAPLAATDLESCRPFWMAVCEKGLTPEPSPVPRQP